MTTSNRLIQQLIADQATSRPSDVAVAYGDETLTYEELITQVRSLAAHLRKKYGVRPGVLVPLMFERSPEMVIGILAVLESGGACLPLDPKHPIARQRFILQDCGASLLLANIDVPPGLAELVGVLDLREKPSWQRPTAPLPILGTADDLIYCLYTSGSTGEPKGVLLEHHGVRNVLRWGKDFFAITPADRVLHKTTYTFDISLVEILLPLASGATLVLLEPGAETSPHAIRAAVVRHGITLIQFVPSGLAAYLAILDSDDPLPGVTRCLAAGEPLRPGLRAAFFRSTTDCDLFNLYGPTETTIYATAALVDRDMPVTAGRPLPNTALLIVDEDGAPVPDGVAGELLIAGDGVTRGYLNRDELTRERYVLDPTGVRWYHTGDLVVRLDSGEIDVVERIDDQVKIRGYRIELGEVENALSALPGVHNSVVIAADLNGQQELVAYWVGDDRTNTTALRAGLSAKLPAYMMPSRFMRLDAFPLTSSGKIHRIALPPPSLDTEYDENTYVAPVDELGRELCAILGEVLVWGRVGLADRFLNLGGDSLKAIEVILRVRARLHRELPIDALLRNETVAALISLMYEEDLPEISPAKAAAWHPLSSGQRSMWLLAQAGASHSAYCVSAAYELRGPLDREALQGALVRILARHESLRTAFVEVAGFPMQQIRKNFAVDWEIETVADEEAAQAVIADFVQRDFDLAEGRLVRFLLLERAPEHHILVVSAHHIAIDGWSLTVLIDDLVAGYEGRLEEAPARLQYKDYAHWHLRMLDRPAAMESLAYWKCKLANAPEPLSLPADRPRPAVRSYRGAVLRRTIRTQALQDLRFLCREEGATLYAGISAVLRVLFLRYTGQRDIVLGASTLGRPLESLHDQVGYYVNTVALRDEVATGTSFRALLSTVQKSIAESVRHGDVPFDRVVMETGSVTAANRNPLFDIMVMLDPAWGTPSAQPAGIQLRRIDHPVWHSKMDLTLYFEEHDDGLAITAEYATDLFDEARIERLLAHFSTLLSSVAATPETAVEELELLTPAERSLVLTGFNATDIEYETDIPVPQLFEYHARRTPERIAVVEDGGTLTFGELNSRANALAWTLRKDHGIGPGMLVALQMDRGVNLTAAILGILKAGGAYLPLSTSDPDERIRAILADSGATVVLADAARSGALTAPDRTILDVTDLIADAVLIDNPPPVAEPDDIAYCIYTSGSTGVPNGVLIEHRGLINRLRWMIDELGLTDSDVVLQKTPYTFDVSVWELLLPGIIGARQVMLAPGGQADPSVIAQAIQRHGVTLLHFVPPMLSQYLGAGEDFTGVHHVVCSGEVLSRDIAAWFFTVSRGAQLHNYYGPTEATIDVTRAEVTDTAGPVTIGRPAANTRTYVLDDSGRPCPIGVPGELYVSGVQISRGYLNRPQKTAALFSADPFRPGARMYRTGDLASWQDNGELRYLGRRDDQVKLRGFRIEPSEIERALTAEDSISRAVVMLHVDPAGNDALWAFVENTVPDAPAAPTQLRAALAAQLPGYMVPAYFVFTNSIPVTRNGKVDRRALLSLCHTAQVSDSGYVAPRTTDERRLATLWADLLRRDRIGTEDDFFAVGGNSLSALQLSTRISRDFGVELKLATLFTHRTITAQARLVADLPVVSAPGSVLIRVPRGERHTLSFAQEGMWFLHMLDPDSGSYNIPVLIHLEGPLDPGLMERAVSDLMARHEMLRTTFTQVGGQVFQRVRDDLAVPFEVRDLSELPDKSAAEEAARQARKASSEPFRLEESLPLRVMLFRLGIERWQLLVVVHHVAGDGWTLRLIMQELSSLYAGHPLPAPSVQYIDYAAAIRDPGGRAAIENDLAYWVDRLAGAPTLDLPTDEPDRNAPERSASLTMEVGAGTADGLRELAARTTTTPFEITMTALTLVLSRLSDQEDVVVGFPVVFRPDLNLERAVGLFLNTLVLRTDLTGATAFTDLLERVSSGVREAYEHQAAPFELLVERLNPERALDRSPVFDVLLNHLGDMTEDLVLDGVTSEVDDQAFDPQAKFPLTFYVRDKPHGAMLLELVYRTDLFSPARAETMVAQLVEVLDQAAANADRPITSFTLEAGAARRQRAQLATPLARPPQVPIPELIARVAARDPARIAVRQGVRTLTYGDLIARSDAVAREVLARGCSVSDVVGITGARSIGFIVGLLGVLRSGAIAFPLDATLPEGRARHLQEIARSELFVRVGDGSLPGVDTIVIDANGASPRDEDHGTPLPTLCEADPAYLIFTSGTTGVPRGVLGRHGGLSHFLAWQAAEFGVGENDRCSQLTSVSFDVMLRDTFLALVSGGTVVVPEEADEWGGKAIFRWLDRERITILHAAPTVLQTWLLDADIHPADLRLVVCSGEPMKAALVESIRRHCPAAAVICLYGTTETTLAKSFLRVPQEPLPPVMPIGAPLPQTQIFVLRKGGEVGGVGETGEIAIRTPFRTAGYLHDPVATRERFVPNPLRSDENDLLHLTGDVGRLRPDGLLDILGRVDDQVKINGVRIQPAEVENVLTGHPAVSAGIVVARKDTRGEAHLIAYIVPEEPDRYEKSLSDELRAHLMGLLPAAMVPGEYVVLDRIPTNINGKPDRTALPEPRFVLRTRPAASIAPRTDVERNIAAVWMTVLDGPTPGVEDNFFALGGTSLQLIRLYALLEERFPGTFRIAQLFTHRTIAAQAALVAPLAPQPEVEATEHEF